MFVWVMCFLISSRQKISSKAFRQGVVSQNAFFRNGQNGDGAINDVRLIDRHHDSCGLQWFQPFVDFIKSPSQNMAFQEPIEVPAMTFTFSRASFSARKR